MFVASFKILSLLEGDDTVALVMKYWLLVWYFRAGDGPNLLRTSLLSRHVRISSLSVRSIVSPEPSVNHLLA